MSNYVEIPSVQIFIEKGTWYGNGTSVYVPFSSEDDINKFNIPFTDKIIKLIENTVYVALSPVLQFGKTVGVSDYAIIFESKIADYCKHNPGTVIVSKFEFNPITERISHTQLIKGDIYQNLHTGADFPFIFFQKSGTTDKFVYEARGGILKTNGNDYTIPNLELELSEAELSTGGLFVLKVQYNKETYEVASVEAMFTKTNSARYKKLIKNKQFTETKSGKLITYFSIAELTSDSVKDSGITDPKPVSFGLLMNTLAQ